MALYCQKGLKTDASGLLGLTSDPGRCTHFWHACKAAASSWCSIDAPQTRRLLSLACTAAPGCALLCGQLVCHIFHHDLSHPALLCGQPNFCKRLIAADDRPV